MYYVYSLSDPRTKTVRWIGCTKRTDQRLLQHLYRRDKYDWESNRRQWLILLRSLNLKPILTILHTFEFKVDALAKELLVIEEQIAVGAPLFNWRGNPNPPADVEEQV